MTRQSGQLMGDIQEYSLPRTSGIINNTYIPLYALYGSNLLTHENSWNHWRARA